MNVWTVEEFIEARLSGYEPEPRTLVTICGEQKVQDVPSDQVLVKYGDDLRFVHGLSVVLAVHSQQDQGEELIDLIMGLKVHNPESLHLWFVDLNWWAVITHHQKFYGKHLPSHEMAGQFEDYAKAVIYAESLR